MIVYMLLLFDVVESSSQIYSGVCWLDQYRCSLWCCCHIRDRSLLSDEAMRIAETRFLSDGRYSIRDLCNARNCLMLPPNWSFPAMYWVTPFRTIAAWTPGLGNWFFLMLSFKSSFATLCHLLRVISIRFRSGSLLPVSKVKYFWLCCMKWMLSLLSIVIQHVGLLFCDVYVLCLLLAKIDVCLRLILVQWEILFSSSLNEVQIDCFKKCDDEL